MLRVVETATMTTMHHTNGDDSSETEQATIEDERAQHRLTVMRAERQRRARLLRQRQAELRDYARSGITVLPPGAIMSWVESD